MWVSLIRAVSVSYVLLFVGSSVSTLAGENGSINLTEAIDKTLEHNPGLVAFGYQIQAQQARVTQAELRWVDKRVGREEWPALKEREWLSGVFRGFCSQCSDSCILSGERPGR